jgi:hypothetical protein
MKKFFRDWGAVIIILVIFLSIVSWLMIDAIRCNTKAAIEKDYCGPVIDKGYDPPSSGYKSHTDGQYWLILRDEDCHKAVRVHVTPGAYYEAQMDKRICFTLSARELEDYGNTNELEHLK